MADLLKAYREQVSRLNTCLDLVSQIKYMYGLNADDEISPVVRAKLLDLEALIWMRQQKIIVFIEQNEKL